MQHSRSFSDGVSSGRRAASWATRLYKRASRRILFEEPTCTPVSEAGTGHRFFTVALPAKFETLYN